MRSATFASALLFLCIQSLPAAQASGCTPGWKHGQGLAGCEMTTVPMPFSTRHPGLRAVVRSGYRDAPPGVRFKGNLIYLEGISDSMVNHDELFNRIAHEGYRVIAFDIEGQGGDKRGVGGSPGRWGNTHLFDELTMAEFLYKRYAVNPGRGQKVLMGWSIGGIEAYAAAEGMHPIKPSAVILLAPSIDPMPLGTGEGLNSLPPGKFTLHALVKTPFTSDCPSPLVDPIRPFAPITEPHFAANIVEVAAFTRSGRPAPGVKGLVLMSGPEDTFVHLNATEQIIRTRTDFEWVSYPGTRHLITAEGCDVRRDIGDRITKFLKGL